jgi:hypothetical protein
MSCGCNRLVMLAGVRLLELRKPKKKISFITHGCYRVYARPNTVAIFSNGTLP